MELKFHSRERISNEDIKKVIDIQLNKFRENCCPRYNSTDHVTMLTIADYETDNIDLLAISIRKHGEELCYLVAQGGGLGIPIEATLFKSAVDLNKTINKHYNKILHEFTGNDEYELYSKEKVAGYVAVFCEDIADTRKTLSISNFLPTYYQDKFTEYSLYDKKCFAKLDKFLNS